jgi:hypothetical protein
VFWTALGLVLLVRFAFSQEEDLPPQEFKPVMPTPPAAIQAWLPSEAINDQPKDDELQKLLKARYRESVKEISFVYQTFEGGVGHSASVFPQLIDAASRCQQAALELCRTQKERIFLLEQSVKFRQGIEDFMAARQEQGIDPGSWIYQTRAWRMAAEIELIKAKRSAKSPTGK